MPKFFSNLVERVPGGFSNALQRFRRDGSGQADGEASGDLEMGGEDSQDVSPNRVTSARASSARPSFFGNVRASMMKTSVYGRLESVMLQGRVSRFGGRAAMYKNRRELRRNQAIKMLKDPAEVESLAKLRSKLKMPRKKEKKEDEEEGDEWQTGLQPKESAEDKLEADDEDLLDVIAELGLTVEPSVEELGDPMIVEQRKAGTLNVRLESTVIAFLRHKAKKGRVIFEAENANNIACEMYAVGDYETAKLYYNRALELLSQDRKPAMGELEELKDFIYQWFNGNEHDFYAALSEGEWRMALGRRRFVQVLKKMEYTGNPDRLFGMLDSLSPDGKVSLGELQTLLKLKPSRLLDMDRDLMEKGVVLSNLACVFLQKGEPIMALQKLRDAMVIATSHNLPMEDKTNQRMMGNLAVAYIKLGDLDVALDYLAQLVTVRERTVGRLHEGVLTTLFHVGYCFLVKANDFHILADCKRMDGRIQEKPVEFNFSLALCAFKERLRRQEEIFESMNDDTPQGDKDELRLEIARSQEIVAEIHEKIGEPHRALDFLRKAVEHKEEILCDSDPELLSTWNSYAGSCFKSGCFQDALEAMFKATDTSAALFGEVSATLAKELYHTALILFKMGAEQFRSEEREAAVLTFQNALEKLEQALPIQQELAGADSADVADNIHLQGSVCLSLNDKSEARRKFEQALLSRLKCFGRTHIKVASSCNALGCLYSRMPRRGEEAIQLLRKAVLIREKRLGNESLYLAESLHELGSALLRRGQKQDAETALGHLSKAAQIRDKRVGKKSLLYAGSMHQVGQAHLALHWPAEAKLYFQAAIKLREELLGKKTAQTAASKFGLSLALLELGDLRGSMRNLKASYVAREHLFGMEHPLSADSLHQIGMVYIKKKELQASLPFLMAAIDVRKKLNQKDVEAMEQDSEEEDKHLIRPESERQRRIRHKKEKARLAKIKRMKDEANEEARQQAREMKEKAKAEEEERKRRLAEEAMKAGGGRQSTMVSMLGRMSKFGSLTARASVPKEEEEEGEKKSSSSSSSNDEKESKGSAGSSAKKKDFKKRRSSSGSSQEKKRSSKQSLTSEDAKETGPEENRRGSLGSADSTSYVLETAPTKVTNLGNALARRDSGGTGSMPLGSARNVPPGSARGSRRSESQEELNRRESLGSAESLFGANQDSSMKDQVSKMASTQLELNRDEDADSEVDVSEIGIDVRGYLAGVLANDFHILSKVYLDMKDFEKAKEYLGQSICLREEVFGGSSREFADALHAFGVLYCKDDDPAKAKKYFFKALAVREKVCGHLHPDTAQTEIELGEVLAQLGQPDEASIHLLRGCNIRESLFGTDDDTSKRIREKWAGLSAGATFYDPVAAGEALPHFARRSPESFLHGYAAVHKISKRKKTDADGGSEGDADAYASGNADDNNANVSGTADDDDDSSESSSSSESE